ncbi:hypothetical protein [Pollutimonas thiosulfatoxidans]|uniref:hypothetical protein n=1 Tax=Pollutimonas thiosulfatoxidans TaxID=2028345 RepID=UPI001D190456|nr:hypothetical protein [Pollutimonas thiosulfatoxidans]
MAGSVLVTVVYLLVNYVYLRIFGLQGLRATHAVGADLMHWWCCGGGTRTVQDRFVCRYIR